MLLLFKLFRKKWKKTYNGSHRQKTASHYSQNVSRGKGEHNIFDTEAIKQTITTFDIDKLSSLAKTFIRYKYRTKSIQLQLHQKRPLWKAYRIQNRGWEIFVYSVWIYVIIDASDFVVTTWYIDINV